MEVNVKIKRNDDDELVIIAKLKPLLMSDLNDKESKETFMEVAMKQFKEELEKNMEKM